VAMSQPAAPSSGISVSSKLLAEYFQVTEVIFGSFSLFY